MSIESTAWAKRSIAKGYRFGCDSAVGCWAFKTRRGADAHALRYGKGHRIRPIEDWMDQEERVETTWPMEAIADMLDQLKLQPQEVTIE